MEISILHRKERLVITAIEILDELGIQGLSTREIAKRQGVSEATLFRHFRSKDDLLGAMLDHFAKFDVDIFQSIRLKKLNFREAVTYLVTSYVQYYENYPAITAVMQAFDVLKYEPGLADKIRDILNGRSSFVAQLAEAARENGEIRPEADCDSLSDIIWGICLETCLKWRVNDRAFSLSGQTLSTLNMVLDAFYTAGGQRS
jgi:AcrR family transcriptional regulator